MYGPVTKENKTRDYCKMQALNSLLYVVSSFVHANEMSCLRRFTTYMCTCTCVHYQY